MASTPEAQDALFHHYSPSKASILDTVPPELTRASLRLRNPPSYVVVGVYRLCTDSNLYVPIWDKCRHATIRGLVIGAVWAALTFELQRKFIKLFLSKQFAAYNWFIHGRRIRTPDSIQYAAMLLVGSQVTWMLRFFLAKNIRIARERAWAQTVSSRGKAPDFWQPYVEEWENPPQIERSRQEKLMRRFLTSPLGIGAIKVILLPFHLYPFVGVLIVACLKALGTAQYLHKPYFESKKMSQDQIETFIEERKWNYFLFGYAAALLESIPIVGLIFSVSNRIGAAMWAHDLEKIQHFVLLEREKRE